MRYISVFSGIEAATVAWEPLGWEPVCFAEIDPFPSAVLAHRFPNVPNYGDITKIDWSEVIERHGSVDLVVGGSPCQSFSIAGGRESLDGESALCFEYYRCLHDVRPRWFVWENVPGVFSTRDNAFGQFLGKLEELGYGMAWRTLDAQFFGVAQRRRRVFLVGHLGGMVGAAAAVLFDRDSLRGNTASSREKRQALAGDAGFGSESGGFCPEESAKTRGVGWEAENSPTLRSGTTPAVISLQSDGGTSLNGNGMGYCTDGSAYTVNSVDRQAVAFAQNQRGEVRLEGLDGSRVGALAAKPDFKSGQGASLICMESAQASASIAEGGEPTLNAIQKQPTSPHRTERTCSPHYAPPMAASSSSTTRAYGREGSSSKREEPV